MRPETARPRLSSTLNVAFELGNSNWKLARNGTKETQLRMVGLLVAEVELPQFAPGHRSSEAEGHPVGVFQMRNRFGKASYSSQFMTIGSWSSDCAKNRKPEGCDDHESH